MSKLLSWFKDLSSLKKAAAIGGVVLFAAQLPFWLSISAMSAFFGGAAISLAVALSRSTRQRVATIRLPGIKPGRRPWVLAAIILSYSMGATVALGVAATVTGDMWISLTKEKIPEQRMEVEKETRQAPKKLEETRPSVEAARKTKTIETEVSPASYSIATVKPVPSAGSGRSRFSYRITVDKTITDKEIVIATIKDLLKNRARGDAVMVFVYGHSDDIQGVFTKAKGQWSVDGKGWSGDENVDRRLKVEFPSGEIEYRAFSK